MVLATNLGFPRIGDMRQLKKAVEDYWKGNSSQEALLATGKSLRAHNWKLQKDAGIEHIPSNDFSFYDQILDLIQRLNTELGMTMIVVTHDPRVGALAQRQIKLEKGKLIEKGHEVALVGSRPFERSA